MYTEYFHLSEMPFSITPDPKFLYLGRRHREALAHLLYGIKEGNGFVLLTGEVGTGKTTVCRHLLDHLPDNTDVALILNPKLDGLELVAALCDELDIDYEPSEISLKYLIDRLNQKLIANHQQGRHTVLFIDEAQNLSPDALEQIRLLTNLETHKEKLLQIILLGQPELRDLLDQPFLRQVAQRVTARYHLGSLTKEETVAYIHHRLALCGTRTPLFTKAALKKIYELTDGTPRLINILCDRALLGTYAEQTQQADTKTIIKAAKEVFYSGHKKTPSRQNRLPLVAAAIAASILLAAGAWLTVNNQSFLDLNRLQAFFDFKQPASDQQATLNAPLNSKEPTAASEPKALIQAATYQDFATIMSGQEGFSNQADAFGALFQVWNLTLEEDMKDAYCYFALLNELKCTHKRGNWNQVKQFNRPAILKLIKDDITQYAVITRMDDKTLTLKLNGKEETFLKKDVEKFWFGEYSFLWKPPVDYTQPLEKGNNTIGVSWLREKLNSQQPIGADAFLFDEALEKRVMEFQRDRGLIPDGIAGEQTIIELNTINNNKSIPIIAGHTLASEPAMSYR